MERRSAGKLYRSQEWNDAKKHVERARLEMTQAVEELWRTAQTLRRWTGSSLLSEVFRFLNPASMLERMLSPVFKVLGREIKIETREHIDAAPYDLATAPLRDKRPRRKALKRSFERSNPCLADWSPKETSPRFH